MIDYRSIYNRNRADWAKLTEEGNGDRYKTLVAGHYSDNNHFIYELLQNAEDVGATKIIFDYYADRLCVYHNGSPFVYENVVGICSFLEGTKDKDDAQTIGHFGMGFKSVFKYTDCPQVYSDQEAFQIVRYLLPEEIPLGAFPHDCHYMWKGERLPVFSAQEHATKFELPYKEAVATEHASICAGDIVDKLENLEPEILLFLEHIEELKWVDNVTGNCGSYKRIPNKTDGHILTCEKLICTAGEDASIAQNHYIVFRKDIYTEQMPNAHIKVAFGLNATKTNVKPLDNSKIWVFFPTTDSANLKFIIHGTYETPVSREKIMQPSLFNKRLLEETEILLIDSLEGMKQRKLLTQDLLKTLLLPATESQMFPALKEKLNVAISENAYILTADNEYATKEDVCLPIPMSLHKQISKEVLTEWYERPGQFALVSDIHNSREYFNWLRTDIGIKIFTFDDYAQIVLEKETGTFGQEDEVLAYIDEVVKNRPVTYGRRSTYNELLYNSIEEAKPYFQQAPIIKNQTGNLVAPFDKNDVAQLYTTLTNDYMTIPPEKIVDAQIVAGYADILTEYLGMDEFDNYKYVKTVVLSKYHHGKGKEILEISDEQHIADIKAILSLMEAGRLDSSQLRVDFYLIRCKDAVTQGSFCCYTSDSFLPVSDEGLSTLDYFQGVHKIYIVNTEFYNEYGISEQQLKQLGVQSSFREGQDIDNGEYKTSNPGKNPWWYSCRLFWYKFTLRDLDDVLTYIESNPKSENARIKSKMILKMLFRYEMHLHGEIKVGITYPTCKELNCELVGKLEKRQWLYTNLGELTYSWNISKYDLDGSLYGVLQENSKVYEILGFDMDERDEAEAKQREYEAISPQHQEEIATRWLRENPEMAQRFLAEMDISTESQNNTTFCPQDTLEPEFEFPSRPVKNLENLRRHVERAVVSADPVRYERVQRSIRVTDNNCKSYLSSMYSVDRLSHQYACQMCQEPGSFVSTQIDPSGEMKLELEQLYLCLCPNCARKYWNFKNDPQIIKRFWDDLDAFEMDNANGYDDVQITMPIGDSTIRFVETHLAEIQYIRKLTQESLCEDE